MKSIKNLTEEQRENLSKNFQEVCDNHYNEFCIKYKADMIQRIKERSEERTNNINFDLKSIINHIFFRLVEDFINAETELKNLEPTVKTILDSINGIYDDIIYEMEYFKTEYVNYETVCKFLEDNKIDITKYIDL